MKTLVRTIAAICAVVALSSTPVWAVPGGGGPPITEVTPTCTSIDPGPGIVDGVNIRWPDPDGKHFYSYDIILSSHVGDTWTYKVEAAAGSKALSHWLLEECEGGEIDPPYLKNHIVDTDPNASIGKDGSTGIDGVKWDTTGGTFVITMDNKYRPMEHNVWAKSSTYYAGCTVLGPGCPLGERGNSTSVIGFDE